MAPKAAKPVCKFRQEITGARNKKDNEQEGGKERVDKRKNKKINWFRDQLDLGVRKKKQSQVTSEVPGGVTGWDGGAIRQDLKYWEGSEFGHVVFEVSGGVWRRESGCICELEVLQQTVGS